MTEREEKALQVAYLTALGLSQNDIAARLRMSQPEVSRLLTIARSKEFLTLAVKWPEGGGYDRTAIQALVYPRFDELKAALDAEAARRHGVPISQIHVVHLGTRGANAYHEFGEQAARLLTDLFAHAHIAAVAWGHTVLAAVNAIAAMSVKARPSMTILPISGEPLNNTENGVSPSTAAKRLATSYGCTYRSLRGIPSRIPKSMKGGDADVVRRFFRWSKDYSAIFGPDANEPLINQVDMIVMGVGDAASSKADPFFRETCDAEGMQPDDLTEIAVGNLGGIWLAPDGARKSVQASVDAINERGLGIQARHFDDCARRAAGKPEAPGVVAMARGKAKAAIVKRAAGMVNRFIIDEALADAIVGG
jgi:DNA-binding transcriptional regulator LsrR (DeoR family)